MSIRYLQDTSTPGWSCDSLTHATRGHTTRDSMTAAFLDKQPQLFDTWSSMNPLGRLGRPDELRGVVTWLASDASTFCTGSEYVVSFASLRSRRANRNKHHCQRRSPLVVIEWLKLERMYLVVGICERKDRRTFGHFNLGYVRKSQRTCG